MRKLVLLSVFLFAAVVVSGCLGGGSAQEVRGDFLEKNVSAYTYDGELSYTISTPRGPPQTTTVERTAAVDRVERELRANSSFATEVGGQSIRSSATTYLVNGSVFSRTSRNESSTGWTQFDRPREVNATWRATDSLALYASVLMNASVNRAGTQEIRGRETHALRVEPGPGGRTRLLLGKFRDQQGFFRNQTEFDSFNMTVWISTESLNLLQAETNTDMTLTQNLRGREVDFSVNVEFDDTFSYGDVDVDLPSSVSKNLSRAP